MNTQDEEMFGQILGNETTCRMFWNELKKRGVKADVDVDELSHEDVAEICIHILSELKRMEK